MRRRSVVIAAAVGLALAGAAVVSIDGLRWRAHLVGLKAAGRIPDLGWLEMARMLRPRGRFYLRPLIETRNPNQSILAPDTSAADVAAGAETYRRACASCHGSEAYGGAAPSLRGTILRHGSSDWAVYRTISLGIPSTDMPGSRLPERERWRLVAFLKALRTVEAPPPPQAVSREGLERLRPVSAEALLAARSDSANWLSYSGAYDGRRYSTLAQINRGTVQRLRLLWMYQVEGRDRRVETTPLVVDGIMFFTTPTSGVRALDAESGTQLWAYDRALPDRLQLCCGRVNRGVAILDSTLYLATLDAHLVALDARSGKVRWDVAVADPALGYSFTSAPLAVKDLIVIGNAGGEFATRGFVDAYDAATGKRRWRFVTIPAPGSPGNESWSGNSWQTGGGPAWLTGSYDPVLDLLYWGTGNPNPDYNGDGRLGDNLYTNSVVALDRATGTLRWHFQFTPHDVHDWDAAHIPVLVEAPGNPRPLLLTANKNGFYYVLDRATGRFLRARAFVRQSWARGIDSSGRPILETGTEPTRTGTPVSVSGTGWWSPSYSPRTGSFYVQTFERQDLVFKDAVPEAAPDVRMGGARTPAFPGRGRGALRALDAMTGELRWEHETFTGAGDYLEFVGGLLSTAGDLVFGSGADVVFALDAQNGRKLWSFKAGGGVHAAPVTYLVGGRQRVTVAAGRAVLTFGID